MQRLARLTLILLGLGLMLTVGLRWWYHAHHPAPPLIIGLGFDATSGANRLYISAVGFDFQRAITPTFDAIYYVDGPTPDGWVYFEADSYVTNPNTGVVEDQGGLYRVKAFGAGQQRLITHPINGVGWGYTAYLTPDHQHLIYAVQDPTTAYYQFYRANLDGSQTLALSPTSWDVSLETMITEGDTTWLIAEVYRDAFGPYLMRGSLAGNDWLDLAAESAPAYYDYWLPDVGWLIYSVEGRLWKTRLDGTGQMPIGPTDRIMYSVDWLPDAQILVAVYYQTSAQLGLATRGVVGIRLSDGVTLWDLNEYEYGGRSPDGKWLAVFSYQHDPNSYAIQPSTIERMRPDGTQRHILDQADQPINMLVWSGQSLYFTIQQTEVSLWRLNLATPSPQKPLLIEDGLGAMPHAWTDDWHSIIVGEQWVDTVSHRRGSLGPANSTVFFLDWVSFTEPDWSPVGLLGLGSVLLLGGLYRRRGKAKL